MSDLLASSLPDGIGVLLPSKEQCRRDSKVLHAFKLPVEDPARLQGRLTERPPSRSLCGVDGWREGSGAVSCKSCLRILASLVDRLAG